MVVREEAMMEVPRAGAGTAAAGTAAAVRAAAEKVAAATDARMAVG